MVTGRTDDLLTTLLSWQVFRLWRFIGITRKMLRAFTPLTCNTRAIFFSCLACIMPSGFDSSNVNVADLMVMPLRLPP